MKTYEVELHRTRYIVVEALNKEAAEELARLELDRHALEDDRSDWVLKSIDDITNQG
jgi:hypothetical protein